MKHTLKYSALAIALALSCHSEAANVSGIVTDKSGKPIEGAVITVRGTTVTATTDSAGRYRLDNLPDGHVHLHVVSSKHIHGDLELEDATGERSANFSLQNTAMENIVVTANSLETTVLESVTPVSVLAGEELRKRQMPTLGETLKTTPGIHSTYFASVAGNPVIRGNDGPRVKITQNNLDVSDASRVGADHNVGTDASTAIQIEVLRGPATLQYGSGAIGGVVNVVDNRIPKYVPDGLEGEAELRHETATNERFGKVDLNVGDGNWAFHVDAFTRETDDVEIPGFAEREPEEDEEEGTIENSSIDAENVTVGLSYVGDKGYFGASMQILDNMYGVPGHSHHHHEDEEEHDEDEHDEEEHGEEEEEIVMLDVDNRRYQVAGELYRPFEGINNIKIAAGYTDYQHVEFEGDTTGTRFANETSELRLSADHESLGGWHGTVGLHLSNSDFEAIGDEAFTPANETQMVGLYIVEEKQFGDVLVQLGGRIERNELSADSFDVPLAHEEEHDEDHDDDHDEEHEDEHEHEEELTAVSFPDLSYTSMSLSAGFNWQYTDGYSFAANLSHSQRAPTQAELFSAGEHVATSTFDLGAFFTLNDEGEIELSGSDIDEEVANNIDLTWRKFSGDWGFTITLFYNQVDNYLYQADTGFTFEDEHGHEDEHHDDHDEDHEDEHEDDHDDEHGDEHDHEEEEALPILNFRQEDATLYGFEAEMQYQINDIFRIKAFGDYIRAEVDSGDLPRIPPLRFGGELAFEYEGWAGDIGAIWYDDQTNVAEFESETEGYTLLEAGVTYTVTTQNVDWLFFARGTNLTDEEARVHSSFLVDDAPLPGRGFTMGVRANF